MLSDLLLSFRYLGKTPGVSVIAVFTLAVGIAAVVSIFAALRALVLEPFDYPDSHEMVQVWSGDGWPLSPADFLDLREKSDSFESFGVYTPQTFSVGAENAQAVRGVRSVWPFKGFGIDGLWHGRPEPHAFDFGGGSDWPGSDRGLLGSGCASGEAGSAGGSERVDDSGFWILGTRF